MGQFNTWHQEQIRGWMRDPHALASYDRLKLAEYLLYGVASAAGLAHPATERDGCFACAGNSPHAVHASDCVYNNAVAYLSEMGIWG